MAAFEPPAAVGVCKDTSAAISRHSITAWTGSDIMRFNLRYVFSAMLSNPSESYIYKLVSSSVFFYQMQNNDVKHQRPQLHK